MIRPRHFESWPSTSSSYSIHSIIFHRPCFKCAFHESKIRHEQIAKQDKHDIDQLLEAIDKGNERLSQVGPPNEYMVAAVKEWKEKLSSLMKGRERAQRVIWDELMMFWGVGEVRPESQNVVDSLQRLAERNSDVLVY